MRMRAALMAVLAVTVQSGARAADAPAKSAGGLLLVANKGDHTLGIIDPVLGKQVATVKQSGVTGHEVIASPDGKTAYVPIYGDSGVGKPGTDGQTMDVIDIASRRLRRHHRLRQGRAAALSALRARTGKLYVSTEITNTITVIDPRDQQDRRQDPDRPTRVAHARDHAGRQARLHLERAAGQRQRDRPRGEEGHRPPSPSRPIRSGSPSRWTIAGSSPPTRPSRGSR